MLHEFVALYRDELIGRCRAKVATRTIPPPTKQEVEHGVPLFLDQLVRALRLGETSTAEIRRTALLHGHELLQRGFTVSQVVHDYGDVCQSITELAVESNAPISTDDFRTLNACLDDAIAVAVTEFARARDQGVDNGQPGREQTVLDGGEALLQSGIDDMAVRASERLAFFAHELRNFLNTANLAFEAIKIGRVGIGGSTSAVLGRSLAGAADLVDRTLAEVRLKEDIQNRVLLQVSEFIEDLATHAQLAADAGGLTLTVLTVPPEIHVEGDRQILTAVVMNLLQNAFKFTRPHTTITLRVTAGDDRVQIEIQDECGGLPAGDVTELFRPFEQRGANRTGLGLGLAFSRWGVEANKGRLSARSLANEGCVFTIDLPRVPVAAAAGAL